MKRATTTFHYPDPDVGSRTVPAGKLISDDDPLLDAYGALFADADDVPAEEKKPARRAPAKSAAKKDD